MTQRKTKCGLMIKKINDRIAKEANSHLSSSGLTLSQLMYLEFMQAQGSGPVHLREFEKYFSTSQPTVSGLIHRMSQKGLVLIALSPDGGRAKTAQLTEKGRETLQQAVSSRQRTEDAILSPLTSEEKERFQEYLERICRYLDGVKELGD